MRFPRELLAALGCRPLGQRALSWFLALPGPAMAEGAQALCRAPWVSSRRWEDPGPQGGSMEQPLVLWGESQGLAGWRGASSKLCSPKVTSTDLGVDVCQEMWGEGWKAFA